MSPEETGVLLRIEAIKHLIEDQEGYLAMLRMRRERMEGDLKIIRRSEAGQRLVAKRREQA